jgi:DNA-binding response OmpR family regulator
MGPEPTILCVDDYPSLLKTLAMALGGLGFRVLQAGTLVEALRLCREYRPDAVLLEYNMCPGCPGEGSCAAEQIKLISPETKVLVWSTDDRALRQPPSCAAATFMKPMDPVEIAARLRAALQPSKPEPGSLGTPE